MSVFNKEFALDEYTFLWDISNQKYMSQYTHKYDTGQNVVLSAANSFLENWGPFEKGFMYEVRIVFC